MEGVEKEKEWRVKKKRRKHYRELEVGGLLCGYRSNFFHQHAKYWAGEERRVREGKGGVEGGIREGKGSLIITRASLSKTNGLMRICVLVSSGLSSPPYFALPRPRPSHSSHPSSMHVPSVWARGCNGWTLFSAFNVVSLFFFLLISLLMSFRWFDFSLCLLFISVVWYFFYFSFIYCERFLSCPVGSSPAFT